MKKLQMTWLKKEVIKILDQRGWDDKYDVDLRSKKSMVNYLTKYEVL